MTPVSRPPSFLSWLVLLGCLAGVGCQGEPPIRQYSVAKEAPRTTAAARESAWFFKLTGPQNAVLAQLQPFSAMLRSLRFNDRGQPVYQTPEGWQRAPGSALRFETLNIRETDPPLSVSVMSLPLPDGTVQEYLLANLNRWREQLGLPAHSGSDGLERSQAAGELIVGPSAAGLVAMVNLTGRTEEFGESRMLAALILPGRTDTDDVPPSTSARDAAPPAAPLSYDIPDGWRRSSGSAMRTASFSTPGDADVSVTRIVGGGGVLENVNRWRGEVKLEPIDEAALKESMETFPIDEGDGTWIEALGDKESALAVITTDGDAKWFFKMRGPKAEVESERERFREFLKSVRFRRN